MLNPGRILALLLIVVAALAAGCSSIEGTGRSIAATKNRNEIIRDKKTGLQGLRGWNEGPIVLAPKYAEIRASESGRAAFRSTEGKWGFIDIDGKEVVPARYAAVGEWERPEAFDNPFNLTYDEAQVKSEGGLWGIVGADGKELLQAEYASIRRQRVTSRNTFGGKAQRGRLPGLFVFAERPDKSIAIFVQGGYGRLAQKADIERMHDTIYGWTKTAESAEQVVAWAEDMGELLLLVEKMPMGDRPLEPMDLGARRAYWRKMAEDNRPKKKGPGR